MSDCAPADDRNRCRDGESLRPPVLQLDDPQIWLEGLETLWEQPCGFLVGQLWRDHDRFTRFPIDRGCDAAGVRELQAIDGAERSEEHTSELQSLMRISYAVFCLKKKNKK